MNGNMLPTPKLASPLLGVEVCRNSCTPERRIRVCVGRMWPSDIRSGGPNDNTVNFIKSPSEHDRLTSRLKSMQLHAGTAMRPRERHHCGIWHSMKKSSLSSSSWTAPSRWNQLSCAETSATISLRCVKTHKSEDLNSEILLLESQCTTLRNVANYSPVNTA